MKIIDGKKVAAEITAAIRLELKQRVRPLHFHCVLVGNDPASKLYIRRKQEFAERLGIQFTLHQLPEGATKEEVQQTIQALNTTPDGFIVQLPLPENLGEHTNELLQQMDLSRDADGLTEGNRKALLSGTGGFMPTPMAAVMILLASLDKKNDITTYLPFANNDSAVRVPEEFVGKRAVVVSDGDVFAPTLAEILEIAGMVVDTKSSFDCEFDTMPLDADVVITSLGKPNFLTGEMIQKGAVVIDVGTTLVNGKTVGDVDWDSIQDKAFAITPVPGGVGPVTVAMLYANLLALVKNE